MTKDEIKEKYKEYFSDEAKVKAFDKIAERYYIANFGSMSKNEFETLLFSIYLEQILDKHEDNPNMYSDYTLSKLLGITQSKVSSLKVRKELLYPYSKFDWRKSLERISKNTVYENGKIKLLIPDRNVYLELKNAIESNGGYVEVQLNENLLQIRPEFFFDLMIAISEEKDRQELRKEIKARMQQKNTDIQFLDNDSIGRTLKKQATEMIPEVIIGLIGDCIPIFGGALKTITQNIYNCMTEG